MTIGYLDNPSGGDYSDTSSINENFNKNMDSANTSANDIRTGNTQGQGGYQWTGSYQPISLSGIPEALENNRNAYDLAVRTALTGLGKFGTSIQNQAELSTVLGPADPEGAIASAGGVWNPTPEMQKQAQENINKNNAIQEAREASLLEAAKAFYKGEYDRNSDYGLNSNTGTEESSTENTSPDISSQSPNERDRKPSTSEMYDEWLSTLPYDLDYDDFIAFQFAGDNSNDWLDFMKYGYDKYGAYSDLADYFGYDREDAEALAAAQEAYRNGYFTNQVATHNINDVLTGTAAGAELMGSYAADRDLLANWIANNGYYLAKDSGTYTTDNGVLGGDDYLTPEDEEYLSTLQGMLTVNALKNSVGNDAVLSMSEPQIDAMLSFYDKFDTPIDYGNVGAAIPDTDLVYSSAGLNTANPAIFEAANAINPMDLAIYLDNPYALPQLAQIYAAQLGYGSNIGNDVISQEQWDNLFNY